jgi:hypothetical protein
MATLNGAEFLEAQLSSIAAQTRLPGELVACDDCSADATVEILERFAQTAPFEVRIVRNDERLGFGRNFMKAARLCRGQLIAWSDQDDVWMPEKVARCLEAFAAHPDVVLAVHSTQIGTRRRHGRPVVKGPLARYESRWREQRLLARHSIYGPDELPLEVSSWGHSCVVSRRVLEIGDALAAGLPGVFDEFSGHDTWTTFLSLAVGRVALLPDVLVQYRQHERQLAGAPAPHALGARVKQSATRAGSTMVHDLEAGATRAFFRTSVLVALAAELDREAGFDRGAAAFRASLDAQVSDHREVGAGRGAQQRAEMWRRYGERLQRRSALWQARPTSPQAAARLLHDMALGDYRPAIRGGLGLRLLARDIWRVAAPRRNASA